MLYCPANAGEAARLVTHAYHKLGLWLQYNSFTSKNIQTQDPPSSKTNKLIVYYFLACKAAHFDIHRWWMYIYIQLQHSHVFPAKEMYGEKAGNGGRMGT